MSDILLIYDVLITLVARTLNIDEKTICAEEELIANLGFTARSLRDFTARVNTQFEKQLKTVLPRGEVMKCRTVSDLSYAIQKHT